MSTKAWISRLALGVSVLVAGNQALAAAGSPAAPDPGETSQYRAMLEEAVSEYDAHRYEEARALFRRAHEISPNARTLRGIGMASFELREYIEALRSLEASLADKRRALTPTQRTQVEALIERTRAFVGRFFLKLSPKETLVRVDGAPAVVEADGSLLLSFGRHALTAEAPGRSPENREINVIGGERQELSFTLRPDGPRPSPSRPAAGGGANSGARRRGDDVVRRRLLVGRRGGARGRRRRWFPLVEPRGQPAEPVRSRQRRRRGWVATTGDASRPTRGSRSASPIGSGVGALALGHHRNGRLVDQQQAGFGDGARLPSHAGGGEL